MPLPEVESIPKCIAEENQDGVLIMNYSDEDEHYEEEDIQHVDVNLVPEPLLTEKEEEYHPESYSGGFEINSHSSAKVDSLCSPLESELEISAEIEEIRREDILDADSDNEASTDDLVVNFGTKNCDKAEENTVIKESTNEKNDTGKGEQLDESYCFEGVIELPSLYGEPSLPVEEINDFNNSDSESQPNSEEVNRHKLKTLKNNPKVIGRIVSQRNKPSNAEAKGINKNTEQNYSMKKTQDYWRFLLRSKSTEGSKFHGFSFNELEVCSSYMENAMRNIHKYFIPVIYGNNPGGLYKCVNCSYSTCFPSSMETKKHISYHESNAYLFKCLDCEFVSFSDEVANHSYDIHKKKTTVSDITKHNERFEKGEKSNVNLKKQIPEDSKKLLSKSFIDAKVIKSGRFQLGDVLSKSSVKNINRDKSLSKAPTTPIAIRPKSSKVAGYSVEIGSLQKKNSKRTTKQKESVVEVTNSLVDGVQILDLKNNKQTSDKLNNKEKALLNPNDTVSGIKSTISLEVVNLTDARPIQNKNIERYEITNEHDYYKTNNSECEILNCDEDAGKSSKNENDEECQVSEEILVIFNDSSNDLEFEIQNDTTENNENSSIMNLKKVDSLTKNVDFEVCGKCYFITCFKDEYIAHMKQCATQSGKANINTRFAVNDEVLLSHMRKTCCICNCVQNSCKDLALHASTVHGLEERHNPHSKINQYLSKLRTCSSCGFVGINRKDLTLHCLKLHKSLPLSMRKLYDSLGNMSINLQLRTCNYCAFIAKNVTALSKHSNHCLNPQEKKICDETTNTKLDESRVIVTSAETSKNPEKNLTKPRQINDNLEGKSTMDNTLASATDELKEIAAKSPKTCVKFPNKNHQNTRLEVTESSISTTESSNPVQITPEEKSPNSSKLVSCLSELAKDVSNIAEKSSEDKIPSLEQSIQTFLTRVPKPNKIQNAPVTSDTDEFTKSCDSGTSGDTYRKTLDLMRNQVNLDIVKSEAIEDNFIETEKVVEPTVFEKQTSFKSGKTKYNLFSCELCQYQSKFIYDITKHRKYCSLKFQSKTSPRLKTIKKGHTTVLSEKVQRPSRCKSLNPVLKKIDSPSDTHKQESSLRKRTGSLSINEKPKNVPLIRSKSFELDNKTRDVFVPVNTEFADLSFDDSKIKSEIKLEEQCDPLSIDPEDLDVDSVESLLCVSRASRISACQKCNYIAESDSELKTHEMKHIRRPVKSLSKNKRKSANSRSSKVSPSPEPEVFSDEGTNTKLVCESCNYVATTRKSLKVHIEYTHINRITENFENNTSNLRNVEEYDTTCNMYSVRFRKCQICGFVAATRAGLLNHMRSRHAKAFENNNPDKILGTNSTAPLEKFQKLEKNGSKPKNSSDHDLRKTKSLPMPDESVQASLYESLSDELKKRFCKLCGMLARNKGGLTYHLSMSHTGNIWKRLNYSKDLIRCEKCSFPAYSKYQLAFHNQMVHSRTFSCEFCDYKAKDRSLVMVHIDSHRKKSSQSNNSNTTANKEDNNQSNNINKPNNEIDTKAAERKEKLKMNDNNEPADKKSTDVGEKVHININQVKVYQNSNYGLQIKNSNISINDVGQSDDQLHFNMLPRSLLTCKICRFKALDQVTLEDHVFGHENGLYPCSFCPFMTKELWNLERHKSQMHPNSSKVAEKKTSSQVPHEEPSLKRRGTGSTNEELDLAKKCRKEEKTAPKSKEINESTQNTASSHSRCTRSRNVSRRKSEEIDASIRNVSSQNQNKEKQSPKGRDKIQKESTIKSSSIEDIDPEPKEVSLEDLDLENLLDHIEIGNIETEKCILDKQASKQKELESKTTPRSRRRSSRAIKKAWNYKNNSDDCNISKKKTDSKAKRYNNPRKISNIPKKTANIKAKSVKTNVMFKCPYCDYKAKFRHALETHFDASHLD